MLTSRKELDALLRGAARAWLDEALAEAAHAAAHPGTDTGTPPWELRFASVEAGTADSNTPTPYAHCCSSKPEPDCPP